MKPQHNNMITTLKFSTSQKNITFNDNLNITIIFFKKKTTNSEDLILAGSQLFLFYCRDKINIKTFPGQKGKIVTMFFAFTLIPFRTF